MSYDFAQESEQTEQVHGPIPEGSLVWVKVECKDTDYPQEKDTAIFTTSTGLKQVNLQLVVTKGKFSGLKFFSRVTLPIGFQTGVTMTEGREKGCRIGGATLKAICGYRRTTMINQFHDLDGTVCPVKVKIKDNISAKGYWNNDLARIVTKGSLDWDLLEGKDEWINKGGAVVGRNADVQTSATSYNTSSPSDAYDYAQPFPTEAGGMDDAPF